MMNLFITNTNSNRTRKEMITKLKQLHKHNPPHSYGDCWRTCVACILRKNSPDEVPHFLDQDNKDWKKDTTNWLVAQGYFLFEVPMSAFEKDIPEKEIVEKCLEGTIGQFIDPIIVSGSSDKFGHSVIAHRGEIIHNPAAAEITGPCEDGLVWISLIGRRI